MQLTCRLQVKTCRQILASVVLCTVVMYIFQVPLMLRSTWRYINLFHLLAYARLMNQLSHALIVTVCNDYFTGQTQSVDYGAG